MAKASKTTRAPSAARNNGGGDESAANSTQFDPTREAPRPDPDRKEQVGDEHGQPHKERKPEDVIDPNTEEPTSDKKWTVASRARWGFGDDTPISELNRDSIEIDKQIAETKADQA